MSFVGQVTRLSQLVADVIIGGIVQTAETGNRVVIRNIGVNGVIQFFTGAAGETAGFIEADSGHQLTFQSSHSAAGTANDTPGEMQLSAGTSPGAIGALVLQATNLQVASIAGQGGDVAGDTLTLAGRTVAGVAFGNFTGNADVNGVVTVPHGLLQHGVAVAPSVVIVTGRVRNKLHNVLNITTTTFDVRTTVADTNVLDAGAAETFGWLALL